MAYNPGDDDENTPIVPRRAATGSFQTVYRAEFADMACAMFKFGLTDNEVSHVLQIHRATLYRWRAENPAFAAACKLGKDEADDRVEQALYSRAIGYDQPSEKLFSYEGAISRGETIEHIPPETKACIYWLNNRRRDQWKNSSELTGKDGAPLLPNVPTDPKDLARYYALIISQGAAAANGEEDEGDGS